MSDEEEYEGIDEETKRALKGLRSKEITVTAELDPKILAKNEWFNRQAERLARELSEAGSPTDSNEINPSNIKEKIGELRGLKELHARTRRDADPTSKISSGTLTLQGQKQGDSETDEWDSVESMINDIQRIKRTGTSLQKKRAQEVLNAMLLKALKGSKEKADLEGKFTKTYEDKDEEGIIQRMNKEFRRRRKLKGKGAEDE